MDAATGEEIWKVIDRGYAREDGRRLTITRKKQALSWVGGDWGTRRVTESEHPLSSMYWAHRLTDIVIVERDDE